MFGNTAIGREMYRKAKDSQRLPHRDVSKAKFKQMARAAGIDELTIRVSIGLGSYIQIGNEMVAVKQ